MIPVGFEDTNKCDNSVVAPVENGATASQAYAVGDHFIKDGAFCTAISAISSGATFSLNSNYVAGQINNTSIFAGHILTSSDNLDNVTEFGVYSWTAANAPINAPTVSNTAVAAGAIIIRISTTGIVQVCFTDVYILFRAKFSTGWTKWRGIQGNIIT